MKIHEKLLIAMVFSVGFYSNIQAASTNNRITLVNETSYVLKFNINNCDKNGSECSYCPSCVVSPIEREIDRGPNRGSPIKIRESKISENLQVYAYAVIKGKIKGTNCPIKPLSTDPVFRVKKRILGGLTCVHQR